MNPKSSDKYKAPALEKGLEIIEFLALQPTAQSQSEIAAGLNRSTNEIYRMLAALEAKGYIHRDSSSLKYALTLKLYYLSHRHSFVEKLRSAAAQPMRRTAAAIQQPCHLAVLFNDKVLVVAYSKSPRPIAVMVEEGNLYSIVATASGKTLLSFLDDNSKEALLSRDTDYRKLSKTQKIAFQKELTTIREQGYAEMPSSYAQGIIDFSVPIGHTPSGINACLTVSKLLTLEDETQPSHDFIIQTMLGCKKEIERNLGLPSLS